MQIIGVVINILIIIILIATLVFAILSSPRKGKGLFCAFFGVMIAIHFINMVYYGFVIRILYDKFDYGIVNLISSIMQLTNVVPWALMLVYVIVTRQDSSSSMVYQQGYDDPGQYGQAASSSEYGYDQGQQGYSPNANNNYPSESQNSHEGSDGYEVEPEKE